MRTFGLLLVPALCAATLAATACSSGGDDNNNNMNPMHAMIDVKLTLTYPDQETADNAVEFMFLIRDASINRDPCELTVFDMNSTVVTAAGTLIDRASSLTIGFPLYTPITEGMVDLFAYTYTRDLDRFCSSNADCQGSTVGEQCTPIGLDRESCSRDGGNVLPSSGGCTRVTLVKDTMPMIAVTLNKMM